MLTKSSGVFLYNFPFFFFLAKKSKYITFFFANSPVTLFRVVGGQMQTKLHFYPPTSLEPLGLVDRARPSDSGLFKWSFSLQVRLAWVSTKIPGLGNHRLTRPSPVRVCDFLDNLLVLILRRNMANERSVAFQLLLHAPQLSQVGVTDVGLVGTRPIGSIRYESKQPQTF